MKVSLNAAFDYRHWVKSSSIMLRSQAHWNVASLLWICLVFWLSTRHLTSLLSVQRRNEYHCSESIKQKETLRHICLN